MSFAAPLFAWISGAVALATVALHLLAWRRPPESPLPTARFAPERPVRMVSRALRPSDIALLALRVLMITLVGAALARPSFSPRREGSGRVIVVDRSRFAGPPALAADAARGVMQSGDALIVFDSAAREIPAPTADSITIGEPSLAAGLLSPALVQAVRAARRLARDRDSVEIVIVSPLVADELDAATETIRRTWPGVVRVVRVAVPPNESVVAGPPAVRASGDDPVAASLSLIGGVDDGATVRVARDTITAADSAWARERGVLVVWPAGVQQARWQTRQTADTAFAVTAIGVAGPSMNPASRPATLVAPFVRTLIPPAGAITARWSDGEPAATETALGSGCIRSVAVPVPVTGDLPLTPAFRRFVRRMVEPCANALPWIAASDSLLARVLPETIAARSGEADTVLAGVEPPSRLTAWLLGMALLAGVAELFVRRGEARATA